jgi:ribosomal silencing factor RsfS
MNTGWMLWVPLVVGGLAAPVVARAATLAQVRALAKVLTTTDPPEERPVGLIGITPTDWERDRAGAWSDARVEARKRLTAAGETAVPVLINLAVEHKDPAIRIVALTALSQMTAPGDADGDEPVTELQAVGAKLTGLLKDTNPGIRYLAARALGRAAYGPAVGALIELAGDPEPVCRMAAADALGRLHEPTAVPVLLTLADKEEAEQSVRLHAIAALGKISPMIQVVPKLLDLLGSENILVRNATATALDELAGYDISEGGLWRIAHRPARRKPLIKDARAWWVHSLKERPFTIKGQPELNLRINIMLQQWQDKAEQSKDVRTTAVRFIDVMNDPRAVDYLIIAMAEKNPDLRAAVAPVATRLAQAATKDPTLAVEFVKDEAERRWIQKVDRFRRRWDTAKKTIKGLN